MTEADHDTLMTTLREAAAKVIGQRSMRDRDLLVDQLVRAAVETVPGAVGGGVSRTESGTVRSSHATSADIYGLDQLQSELGEGPCITAADDPPSGGVVLAHDLAGDDAARFPRFAPAAVRAGYRSVLSVALTTQAHWRSALNLYAHDPAVFDASARLTIGLFGLQAAALLHGADHAAQLGRAVESRDVIGQAKGILMERFTVDDEGAFAMLVESSQNANLKLVDVARWLTGEARERHAAVRATSRSIASEPRD